MGEKEWTAETVFDLFGDELARRILVLASEKPMSADELAEHLEASEPTIYRRVNELEDYDLLDQDLQIQSDGHHHKTFSTALKEITFEIESGGCNIDMQLRKGLVGQFEAFWDDLEQSTPEVEAGSNTAKAHTPASPDG